jgi:hypothetical protein
VLPSTNKVGGSLSYRAFHGDAVGLQGKVEVMNLISCHLFQGADKLFVATLNEPLGVRVKRAGNYPVDSEELSQVLHQSLVFWSSVH